MSVFMFGGKLEFDQPKSGILGILNDYLLFYRNFESCSLRFVSSLGFFVEIDQKEMQFAWNLAKEQVQQWADEQREDGEFEDVSHIKMAGLLLWSFNQSNCISEIRKIHASDNQTLERLQIDPVVVELAPEKSELVRNYSNQACAITFVHMMFCAMQLNRIDTKHGRGVIQNRSGVDLKMPPMTPHYFRNLCRDLLYENPSKSCLYMIYKTMDLYGLKLPESN